MGKEDHEGCVEYCFPTNLMHACEKARPTIVKALIEKGAGLNFLDKNNNSALVSALYADNLECVKLLVEAGIDLDHGLSKQHEKSLDFAKRLHGGNTMST